MSADAQQFFNEKRRTHFPRERNYLDAHITLFHTLPDLEVDNITQRLTDEIRGRTPFPAQAAGVVFMGFGSAYVVECPMLIDIRKTLAHDWQDWLSPQDRQTFRPHVTFQNKVDAAVAKQVYHDEKSRFESFDFLITGLSLWYYDMGPWEHITDFEFQPNA